MTDLVASENDKHLFMQYIKQLIDRYTKNTCTISKNHIRPKRWKSQTYENTSSIDIDLQDTQISYDSENTRPKTKCLFKAALTLRLAYWGVHRASSATVLNKEQSRFSVTPPPTLQRPRAHLPMIVRCIRWWCRCKADRRRSISSFSHRLRFIYEREVKSKVSLDMY